MASHCHPTLSILLVEDDEDTAWSTVELLSLHGHSVRTATCGPDALREAAFETPDVVLLDIDLPGMDGWKVAERLRSEAAGKQPFVVAMTGYGSDGDQLRSADSGVDLHLVKPVDPPRLLDLLAWVRTCLAASRPSAVAESARGAVARWLFSVRGDWEAGTQQQVRPVMKHAVTTGG